MRRCGWCQGCHPSPGVMLSVARMFPCHDPSAVPTSQGLLQGQGPASVPFSKPALSGAARAEPQHGLCVGPYLRPPLAPSAVASVCPGLPSASWCSRGSSHLSPWSWLPWG